jgi:fumarate hydratase subunit alpha
VIRDIDVAVVRDTVSRLLIESNYVIPSDVLDALRAAVSVEPSPLGRETLERLVTNYELAAVERVPVCQDSGVAVVFLEVGQDVHFTGGSLSEAVHEGVREGTRAGYLRWSVTGDPARLLRMAARERGDEAPAALHVDIVPGDRVRLMVAAKGFGAENMSALRMMVPADGVEAIGKFVVETVDRAGANACPPVIVGVGIGSTFEGAAMLAKRAVLRPLTERQARADLRALEIELLERINALGIGPQGFGGRTTALAVNIETRPTHIAGLPVAVNLGCHSTRRAECEL